MKKSLLFLVLNLAAISLYGQTNHFGNLTSIWHVASSYPNGNLNNPSFVETTTTVYGYVGDTVISGYSWSKIYSSTDSLFISDLIFQGTTRDTNGLVLFQSPSSQIDTLYDFNLNVGDSVLYDFSFTSEYLFISNVDSILLNGQYHKRIQISEPQGPNAFTLLSEIWIEGIGSLHGPLFPLSPKVFSTEIPDRLDLTCSEVTSTNYWMDGAYSECYVNIVLGIGEGHIRLFNIYPNPFGSTIEVDLGSTNLQRTRLTVYNSQGQVVYSESLSIKNSTVQLASLNPGIYLLVIETKEGKVTRRLMKK